MPLSNVGLTTSLVWSLVKANVGFANTSAGPTSVNFNLSGVNTATFDEAYGAQFTIAASAGQTIDLTSLTNLVAETFSFGHVLTIMITTTGGPITLSPGASNGLVWFFGGTSPTLTITAGGMFCFSEPVAGPGAVVDGTHKTLLLHNNGGTAATVQIVIVGSTT